ncbi:MAG: sulfatase [Verrucomicrobia bacterium]|nr:sulfatase [Verrucomicrobiota bacterium]
MKFTCPLLSYALLVLLSFACVGNSAAAVNSSAPRLPNIVIIFCDDLGWGDLGCFGSKTIRTPNLDRLASRGTRFTSFYVSQPVCSASRASLLTGCYANRLGIHGALGPNSPIGLNPSETTIASMLKARGAATALIGKWHLGRPRQVLPLQHGFDTYFGLPYSNDMWPMHPTAKPGTYPKLPLIEGNEVVEEMPDQTLLTQRYTDKAVGFIEANAARPFFLFLAHSMPHVPLFAGKEFKGRSAAGLYGDVVEEIDHSVGRIIETLDRLKLTQDTWVVFTSDNGPWHFYGEHAGSAGPFREGKASVFEGGVRTPCIMSWPGRIPSGRTEPKPLMTIDLLPSIAEVTGSPMPALPIDGRSAWSLISGKRAAPSPQEAYYFYYEQGELQAMRSGKWKLHFPHVANGLNGRSGGQGGRPVQQDRIAVGLELYDLENDPGERINLAGRLPAQVRRLEKMAAKARIELGDSRLRIQGTGVRPPLRIADSKPQL